MTFSSVDDSMSPSSENSLIVGPALEIAMREIDLRGITGGGPGGQHVNRSATRIELRWSVRDSASLSGEQRQRLVQKLGARLDSDGAIRIVAGEYRSQLRNRAAALERLKTLVSRALVQAPKRRTTRPTRGSVERRLDDKRKRSETKRRRRDADGD